MSYLRKFVLDKLKIDRSFVAALDAPIVDKSAVAIVQAILELGRALGMQTTAEGVETQSGLDRLRGMGCALAQGFFVAKPMPIDLTHAFIDAHAKLTLQS